VKIFKSIIFLSLEEIHQKSFNSFSNYVVGIGERSAYIFFFNQDIANSFVRNTFPKEASHYLF